MTLPPRPAPDAPDEKDYAETALAEADRAVRLIQARQPGAHLAFLRSWQAILTGLHSEATESKHRRLAWDRAEAAEEQLAEIRTALDMSDTEDHAEVVKEIGIYREHTEDLGRKVSKTRKILDEADASFASWGPAEVHQAMKRIREVLDR
jgi:hypothetical protein